MICTNKQQAEAVALRGAAKMARDGYLVVRNGSRNRWSIYKSDGCVYDVNVTPGAEHCQCEFFARNAKYRTCKHIVAARAERDAEEYCEAHHLAIPQAKTTAFFACCR